MDFANRKNQSTRYTTAAVHLQLQWLGCWKDFVNIQNKEAEISSKNRIVINNCLEAAFEFAPVVEILRKVQ